MGHYLHAIIGPKETIEEFISRWGSAGHVDLPQRVALVPLTPSLHDDIVNIVEINKAIPFAGFERLSAGVESLLRDISRVGLVAYIETDYFGGVGSQRAMAWKAGKVLSGPFFTETLEGTGPKTKPPREWAINRVLLDLGIRTEGDEDPFDTIGLGRFRDTESAVKKPS